MEILIAAIRPKQNTTGQDYRAKFYDILLEVKTHANKKTRCLPKFGIGQDEEPRETTLIQLYLFTGGEHGGIRGERAIVIYKGKGDNSVYGREQPGTNAAPNICLLFCVPINPRDRLPRSLTNSLSFYPLDGAIENINSGAWVVPAYTKTMVKKLDSWLSENYSKPKAIECLFKSRAEYRIRMCINNPAFIPSIKLDRDRGGSNSGTPQDIRLTANEALAKMMAIEKCDKVVMNPLFGSGLPYKTKVDNVIDNMYWGKGLPEYEKIQLPLDVFKPEHRRREKQWEKDYPLHKCAYDNDIEGIEQLLAKGYLHSQLDQDSKWAPIHHAAWCGHVDAVGVLLDAGCSPNIHNNNGSTPLHFAAMCGHPYVIVKLLNQLDTELAPKDREGKTPLDYCEPVPRFDWQQCVHVLKTSRITVSPLHGADKMLNLSSRENTTVQQLNQQMLHVLSLPDSCSHLFTIWICSHSLELQLKLDHKPIQHLKDWKRICVKLTDGTPSQEEPRLVWRRDALLTPKQENAVTHPVAITLMFHEAYHNYMKGLYPCSDKDVNMFAAILTYMSQGEYEPVKAKSFLSQPNTLQLLVPAVKLKSQGHRGNNYPSKIQQQYKIFSAVLLAKDRSKQGLQLNFLQWCRNLTVYGSAFFNGSIPKTDHQHDNKGSKKHQTRCLIGVNDVGIHLINFETRDMYQSFKYVDIEWHQVPERPILEIQLKGSPRQVTSVRTKQAGLIEHLMSKMAHVAKTD